MASDIETVRRKFAEYNTQRNYYTSPSDIVIVNKRARPKNLKTTYKEETKDGIKETTFDLTKQTKTTKITPKELLTGKSVYSQPTAKDRFFYNVQQAKLQEREISSQPLTTGKSYNPYANEPIRQEQQTYYTPKPQRQFLGQETIIGKGNLQKAEYKQAGSLYITKQNIKRGGELFFSESKRLYAIPSTPPKESLKYGFTGFYKVVKDFSPLKFEKEFKTDLSQIGKESNFYGIPIKIPGKETFTGIVVGTTALIKEPKQTLKSTYQYISTPKGFYTTVGETVAFEGLTFGKVTQTISKVENKLTKPVTIPIKNEIFKFESKLRTKLITKESPIIFKRFISKEDVAIGGYKGLKIIDDYSDFSYGQNVNKILESLEGTRVASARVSENINVKKITKKGGYDVLPPDVYNTGGAVGGIRKEADLINQYASLPKKSDIFKAQPQNLKGYELGEIQAYGAYAESLTTKTPEGYSFSLFSKRQKPSIELTLETIQKRQNIRQFTDVEIKRLLKEFPELADDIIFDDLKRPSFNVNIGGKRGMATISPENYFGGFSKEYQTVRLYGTEVKVSSYRGKQRFYTLAGKSTKNVYPKFLYDGFKIPKSFGGGKIEFSNIPKEELVKVDLLFTEVKPKTSIYNLKNIEEKKEFINNLKEQNKLIDNLNKKSEYKLIKEYTLKEFSKSSKPLLLRSSKKYENYYFKSTKKPLFSSYLKESSKYDMKVTKYSSLLRESRRKKYYEKPQEIKSFKYSSFKLYEQKISSKKLYSTSEIKNPYSYRRYTSSYKYQLPKKITESSLSYFKEPSKKQTNINTFNLKSYKLPKIKEQSARLVIPDLYSVNITELRTGKEAVSPTLTKGVRKRARSFFKGESFGYIPTEYLRQKARL